MIPADITPLQWAESISGGVVAVAALIAAALYGIKKLLTAFREVKAELEHMKKKVSSASTAANSAATSAKKIDESLHTNNSGSHVRDDMDKWAKSHAAIADKLDQVIEAQFKQADEARTDRSAADMVHREIFRQIEELRTNS